MEYSIENFTKRSKDIQIVIDELLERYHEITSLREAAVWKSDALALKSLILLFHRDLNQCHELEESLLQQEENVRKNLQFMKRLTASKEMEKKHRSNLQILQEGIESVVAAKTTIEKLIHDIPCNQAELKAIINDLTFRKKELTIEKREMNEEIRLIRTKARQDRAKLSGINRGTMGKIASYQRASITRGKESRLSPLEYAKGDIENQLIEIDKKMNRLNGFKLDDIVNHEDNILRCSYCGRRVNFGEICPGCGSDNTTYELK